MKSVKTPARPIRWGALALGCVLAAPLMACSSSDGDSSSGGPSASTATGGTSSSDSGIGGAVDEGPMPTLPTAAEACPTLTTGVTQFSGTDVQLWVGERREDVQGPVLFYWHGTGSVKEEATVFMQAQIDEVVAEGGIVASFSTSTGTGTYTGPFVWYSDDYNMTDQILACAVEQLNIDPRRIYSAGCSAGGLQSSQMLYYRSSYLAGAMPNSGGIGEPTPPLEDPSHVPSVITTHGLEGSDVVVIDFSVQSGVLDNDIASKGGFVVDCDHGGGHCGVPPEVVAAQWQFLKDHPFGIQDDPYGGVLPDIFPSYCKIIEAP